MKKRANFLQKRLRFNQNTFEHDGVHIKKNRKHICRLSALHLISWTRVFNSLHNPFIDIPSSRSLLGVSGVQIYWTLWTFYQRNALSIRS